MSKCSFVLCAGICACVPLWGIKTHRLQRVETTGRTFNEEAPKSWRSPEVKNYLGSQTVISHKQLTQQANQSIEEALQNVPGVHIRNATGVGAVPSFSVRGFGGGGSGHSNTGMILVNGIPVYVAPYVDIGMPIFPVTFQSVDRISVIKGGESVQYGPNAFGGVINIITKPIPYKWQNQVAERMTAWGRASNGGFVGPESKGQPFIKTLANNFLYNTYLKSGGMINEHFGVQAQANYITGQGFRANSPTNIQNYLLDALYQINENHKITAYYQYYKFFLTDPGSLGVQAYDTNRFQNNRPNNDKSGKAMRWGAVYQTFFGDTSKVGGDFTLTYYGHDMSRDFQFDSNFLNVNTNPNLGPVYTNQNYKGFNIGDHPRRYLINALEPNTNIVFNTKYMKHTLKVGMRYMASDMWFRFLQNKCLSVNNGTCQMSGFLYDKKASQNLEMFNNYIVGYASYKMEFFKGKLTLIPGFRYTFLDYKKVLPENVNPKTGDFSLSKSIKKTDNQYSPAFNLGYKPLENWVMYFNYRRSFIPPQAKSVSIFSTNYNQIFNEFEVGSRYSYKNILSFNVDYFVILAHHYYSGGYGSNSLDINAKSQGVELELYYAPIRGLQMHLAYTYIDARITNNAQDNPSYFEGIVDHPFNLKGKRLPYVSPNQFIFDMSYTYKHTTFGLSSYFYSRSYSSILNQATPKTVCFNFGYSIDGATYGCNSVGLLPWYWVWNVQLSQVFWQSGRHKITGSLQVNNLFDMKYYFRGLGTSPTGREPGPGRSVTAYLSYEF
ncbi:TonB-dependent receptor family protein [Helicobacter ailurogastricus]|uniref:Iron(III) dicitrate transport protein FecA n=1 Tax=Helicobacter ailurogastricus TaxID=1578720 RepID=A0A0K2Y2E8_9HELI|nr:TonB-dependent receptor family protein [Helicobacter ailurogastricus]BDQ29645.1 ligand-gated channel [Helicobacter ailurogastricus]CRF52507.1 Iron(III) dicitrate transport protein FecA [Helicobacter ailurogastricus]